MLVLIRKIGERLTIGDNITVVVNRIQGNRVTLGIGAPPDVPIVRTEPVPGKLIKRGPDCGQERGAT